MAVFNYRLLDGISDPIYCLTHEGHYLYVNQAYAEVVQKTAGYIIGKTMWDVFPCDEADKRFTALSEVIHTKKKKLIEVRVPRSDGDRYYMTTITPIPDADGKTTVFVCSSKDITERKQAEDAIRKSEERFRNLFMSMSDGFYLSEVIYDDKGEPYDYRYLEINPAFERILGLNRDQIIGKTYKEIVPVDTTHWLDTYFTVAKTGKPLFYEFDSSEYNTKFETYSYQPEKGKVTVLVRDISERKRVEAEREKLQAQLTQAQKMESVGRLAGGVAHDFNNMLGIILGHAEIALERISLDDELHAELEEIKRAAERSADLTRQLLAFARKQTVAPRVIDLNAIVEGMLNMLRRLIGEDIHLDWIPGKEVASLKIDPSQIDQILANLCVNARDAISGNGRITIETDNAAIDSGYCIQHTYAVPGDYVMLAVSDNGCGMNQDTIGHLFEPFFTTKETGKGTGLGLATVYGVVKQNQGFINVYSEPGLGTTFRIYLPQYTVKTATPSEQKSLQAERGSETILLVEDELAILNITMKMLSRRGYNVLTATTPGEAISIAREHTGQIDLLMTDVVMPEMNGRELAKNILSIYPNIKRLFMSGYTADVIAHHGVLDEGVQFIHKPFSIKDLEVKLREVLENK